MRQSHGQRVQTAAYGMGSPVLEMMLLLKSTSLFSICYPQKSTFTSALILFALHQEMLKILILCIHLSFSAIFNLMGPPQHKLSSKAGARIVLLRNLPEPAVVHDQLYITMIRLEMNMRKNSVSKLLVFQSLFSLEKMFMAVLKAFLSASEQKLLQDGRLEDKGEFLIENASKQELRITLWGDAARRFDQAALETSPLPIIIVFLGFRIRENLPDSSSSSSTSFLYFTSLHRYLTSLFILWTAFHFYKLYLAM